MPASSEIGNRALRGARTDRLRGTPNDHHPRLPKFNTPVATAELTVAVKVTASPAVEGPNKDDTTVVVVAFLLTV